MTILELRSLLHGDLAHPPGGFHTDLTQSDEEHFILSVRKDAADQNPGAAISATEIAGWVDASDVRAAVQGLMARHV